MGHHRRRGRAGPGAHPRTVPGSVRSAHTGSAWRNRRAWPTNFRPTTRKWRISSARSFRGRRSRGPRCTTGSPLGNPYARSGLRWPSTGSRPRSASRHSWAMSSHSGSTSPSRCSPPFSSAGRGCTCSAGSCGSGPRRGHGGDGVRAQRLVHGRAGMAHRRGHVVGRMAVRLHHPGRPGRPRRRESSCSPWSWPCRSMRESPTPCLSSSFVLAFFSVVLGLRLRRFGATGGLASHTDLAIGARRLGSRRPLGFRRQHCRRIHSGGPDSLPFPPTT